MSDACIHPNGDAHSSNVPCPLAPKTYLITGGTGTLGTALVHSLLAQGHKVRTLSRNEHRITALEESVTPQQRSSLSAMCGDVRSASRLRLALRGVDYVIHAAALKGVGRCEYDPSEAVQTNVQGTINVAIACVEAGVKRAVFCGTDKLINASTLYGMTKAVAERVWLASNTYSAGVGTEFVGVRWGNVFGSAGSVIHRWREQAKTGTIKLTDPEATRFHIRLEDAVPFILATLHEAETGEVRIPILPAYRLRDLATAFAPDCKREVIGLTPGEKRHEMMINENESAYTRKHDKHYSLTPTRIQCGERFEYTSGTPGWKLTVDQLCEEIACLKS